MQVGITLPSFQPTGAALLETAREAERVGIDGVFAFDHLWPGRQKSRPALSLYPVLGAVMAATQHIRVGSLVARIGLVPDRVVISSFISLLEMGGHRLVAALGVGDSKSMAENKAFGIEWLPIEDRRRSLAVVLDALGGEAIECWVGANATATLDIARAAGVAVNLWDVELDRLRAEARLGATTWAGSLPTDAPSAARRLVELRDAGAEWVIWGWPRSTDLVVRALSLAGMRGSRG